MSDDAFERLLASLPDPRRDEMPPMVQAKPEDIQAAKEERREEDSWLDSKADTESRVKTALGSVFGMRLKKDGDYQTIAGGRQVWVKKISDYVGSTPGVTKNYHTYVEVKGVSPGKTFYFGRLDKRNNPDQPSQFEKLSKAHKDGNLVFLAIGWWIATPGAKPIKIKKGSKNFTKWYKEELELEITVVPWGRWVEYCNGTKKRSISRMVCNRDFADCRVVKVKGRWGTLKHWWDRRYEEGGILYAK